ncbi:MAG: hypothetical protein ACR2ND_04265 [Solirubrobacteraceae bacterium]
MSTIQFTEGAASSSDVWTATGLEPQVFLDRSGRRAGRVRLGGVVAAIAAAGWFSALVSGAAGFSTLPAVPATLAAKPPAHVVVATPRHGIVRVASSERPTDRG